MLNVNDLVEEIHRSLFDDEIYRALLSAVWDYEAVEGSLVADDYAAAYMIRDKAKEIGSRVGKEKTAVIVKALHVVLRRFACGRKERRGKIEGVVGENFIMRD